MNQEERREDRKTTSTAHPQIKRPNQPLNILWYIMHFYTIQAISILICIITQRVKTSCNLKHKKNRLAVSHFHSSCLAK